MKTRREFFRILAGSMAVVAACVYAPKSLMAKEERLLHSVEERLDNIDSWIQVSNKRDSNNMVGISQEKMWEETKKFIKGAFNG